MYHREQQSLNKFNRSRLSLTGGYLSAPLSCTSIFTHDEAHSLAKFFNRKERTFRSSSLSPRIRSSLVLPPSRLICIMAEQQQLAQGFVLF